MGIFKQERITWIRVRIAVLVVAMAAGAAAVARGSFELGVSRRDELKRLSDEQYKRRITLPARRGMITDRHGEELAVEVEMDSVYADARKIADPRAAAALLAPLLDMDADGLAKKLASKHHFIWLSRQVAPAVVERIRALNIDGIAFLKESKRFYPNRSLAAHLIGFAGIDAVGLEGIELKFEEQLKGQKDAVLGMRDARGRVVFADNVFGPEGVVGNTIELTIDRTLQYIAEQELVATVRTFDAKAGQIIIMDPNTGEILALANWPSFNPNSISESKPDQRRNRAALDVFEPGSTFKIFTLSAALNSGVLRPDDLIYCERGRIEIGDKIIHDDHADGWLNPIQCLKRSSNICFAKIALKLGKARFYHYLRRFGFGEQTHVDLPFEAKGTLHHYKKWYDIDTSTIAFGQGIGTTGLQLTAALSSIANGGMLMRPRLVKRIVGPDKNTIKTFAPEPKRRVVSQYTARLVGDIMTSVTEEGGTGTEGSLDGFLVAGKTGTAQKSDGSKGYSEEKRIASFIGFVPAEEPRLAISVIIDEPLINQYGGTVAAPALRRVADQALRYLGVSPSMQEKDKAAWINRTKKDKKASAKSETPPVEEELPDPVDSEQPAANLGPNQIPAPDLTGMTMSKALKTLAVHELRPLFIGTGFAVEQVPGPRDPIERGGFVQVNFEPSEQESEAPKTTGDGG